MTGTAAGLLGFAVLIVAGGLLEVAARRGQSIATAGESVAALMRTTSGRAAVLVTWVWLGVHFLAR